MTRRLPTAAQAKEQAKRLRIRLSQEGTPAGHGKCLELVARRYGFRDWNAMLAAIETADESWRVGDRVTGEYLSQPFAATVLEAAAVRPGWVRLDLQLDEAVDVVTFESFSNLRRRVRGVDGPKGFSAERTSDGQPHLRIDLA